MKLRNQTIMRFLLSVATLGTLCAIARAQGGSTSSPAVGGESSTAAAKTKGCSQFNSQNACISGVIIQGAAEAKAILEGGRYTPDRSGPALYVWMVQTCPWSQAFFRDRARFGGVQFRYYAVALGNASSVQTMVSRSLPDFVSYMGNPLLGAAPHDPAHDSAFEDQAYRNHRLMDILAENGVPAPNTPIFYWIGRDGVFWATGWGRHEYESGIIASVKSAAVELPESAGSAAAGEITAGATEIKTLLEGGRYTADGSGPALYALISQSSFPSKEFFKEREQFNGVQFRYYPMYLKTDNPDQVVQAMESRSLPDLLSFANQTLRAPPYRQDNARIDILNDVYRRNQRLDAILTQESGVSLPHMGLMWFWFANGKVYWTFGYTPEYMAEIVASVKSSSAAGGPQSLQPIPPRAPSSPANLAPFSSPATPGTDPLASIWQSEADTGETFRFRLDGDTIDIDGGQQELLGTLERKGKNVGIDTYQALIRIPPLTRCPGGSGLMQINSRNENRLDAKIEPPLSGRAVSPAEAFSARASSFAGSR